MKKIFLMLVTFLLAETSSFAAIDRYKTDLDIDKTINHITYELPLFYGKDRTNLMGVYTLALNIEGKQSGTLSFDFKQNENSFSTEIRNSILRIAKDLRESDYCAIEMSFIMSNGEKFTFDGSYFNDWKKEEWNQLLHVSRNSETGEYRSYIMFPLEYMTSSTTSLSGRVGDRYKYMLKALSTRNIAAIEIWDQSINAKIHVVIPINRPTVETMKDMINKKVKQPKQGKTVKDEKPNKARVQYGKQVKRRR